MTIEVIKRAINKMKEHERRGEEELSRDEIRAKMSMDSRDGFEAL